MLAVRWENAELVKVRRWGFPSMKGRLNVKKIQRLPPKGLEMLLSSSYGVMMLPNVQCVVAGKT